MIIVAGIRLSVDTRFNESDLKVGINKEEALARVKSVITAECRRAYSYAKEHTDMTFKDRSGALYRAIQMFRVSRLRGKKGDGYRASFGIDQKATDARGVPAVKKFRWLTGGTPDRSKPYGKFFQWEATARPRAYSKGNYPKYGKNKGKYWRVNFVSGIEPRNSFLANAFARTRRIRNENIKKVLGELLKK